VRPSPGAKLLSNDGRYVANAGRDIVWTFTTANHPAQPSAVCRRVVEKDGQLYVHMEVQCGGAKADCDRLVQDFNRLNEQMIVALRRVPPWHRDASG